MKYEINAKLFNATLAAQATNDTRYYLSGFFLCAEHNELVATNGDIMCIAPIKPTEDQPDWTECNVPAGKQSSAGWIFGGITKPLPKSAESLIIDTEIPHIEVLGVKYRGPKYIALELIDGSYPAYRSVKAENEVANDVDAERGFNTEYLYRCFRWAGIENGETRARFVFPKSKNDSVEIHPTGAGCTEINQLHITLMPVRV